MSLLKNDSSRLLVLQSRTVESLSPHATTTITTFWTQSGGGHHFSPSSIIAPPDQHALFLCNNVQDTRISGFRTEDTCLDNAETEVINLPVHHVQCIDGTGLHTVGIQRQQLFLVRLPTRARGPCQLIPNVFGYIAQRYGQCVSRIHIGAIS